ncbi:putative FAD-binding, type 2, subdomain 1 [Lupinus albus]|uniref:Putative FAD-binding, type 2, subdomain 1 n=1 Tax=Lupinus albus TaxID=3870 RepID=A0A6A4PH47_LUPAL|nr:putative FAD-binding, type 2, subdomain 1 [Lupinus albus]
MLSKMLFISTFLVLLSISLTNSIPIQETFNNCLKHQSQIPNQFPSAMYTPNNSSFTSVLEFTANNLRYLLPSVPKPEFIFIFIP